VAKRVDESLNVSDGHLSNELASDDQNLGNLSEIYDDLRMDAKRIVIDLEGGVRMWREAAGANLAVAGFVLILALTSYRLYSPLTFETTTYIVAEIVLAVVMLGLGFFGLRRYFQLQRRYKGLFERAKHLG